MIVKSDLILLLTEMENEGLDVKNDMNKVLASPSIPLDVLKRVNDHYPLDVLNFYEKIRKSYNDHKSKLYINIMKSDENLLKDPSTILVTLSSLLNQILLFKPSDKALFLKHSRADEISKVLGIYFNNYNLEPATQLLKLFKADIKVLSMIK